VSRTTQAITPLPVQYTTVGQFDLSSDSLRYGSSEHRTRNNDIEKVRKFITALCARFNTRKQAVSSEYLIYTKIR